MSEQLQQANEASQMYKELTRSLAYYFEGYGFIPSYFDGYASYISPLQIAAHLQTEGGRLLVFYKLGGLTQKIVRFFLGQDEYDPSTLGGKKFAYPGARMVFGENIIKAQNLYTQYAQDLARKNCNDLPTTPYDAWARIISEYTLMQAEQNI